MVWSGEKRGEMMTDRKDLELLGEILWNDCCRCCCNKLVIFFTLRDFTSIILMNKRTSHVVQLWIFPFKQDRRSKINSIKHLTSAMAHPKNTFYGNLIREFLLFSVSSHLPFRCLVCRLFTCNFLFFLCFSLHCFCFLGCLIVSQKCSKHTKKREYENAGTGRNVSNFKQFWWLQSK